MQVVEIDDIRAQPPERLIDVALHRLGTTVDDAFAVGRRHAALAREYEACSERTQHVADQLFVVAKAVERRCIEVTLRPDRARHESQRAQSRGPAARRNRD